MRKTSFVKKQAFFRLGILTTIMVLINIVAAPFFKRIDLTDDQRFSISDSTKTMLRNLKGDIFIQVYLKSDALQPGMERLATATHELLDEFKVYAGNRLHYNFSDPLEGKSPEDQKDIVLDFMKKGLSLTKVREKSSDQFSEKIVVPSAMVSYNNNLYMPVNLIVGTDGALLSTINLSDPGAAEGLNTTSAKLEDKFASVIRSLSIGRKPVIGYVTGHGELDAEYTADIDTALKLFYEIRNLDLPMSFKIDPLYKCLIVAKPRGEFLEREKFLLDQYIMHGGKVLWLVEGMNAEFDSLAKSPKGSFMAQPYPFNLNEDLFFRFGFRINLDLLQDVQCNPIPIQTNLAGTQTQYELFANYYFPVLVPDVKHIITKNIPAVTTKFTSTIDTVKSVGVKKTVLLHSSTQARTVGNGPWVVDYHEFKQPADLKSFNKKDLIAGLLLEGTFSTNFKNRLPERFLHIWTDSLQQTFLEQSVPTKMIVISDGDIIRNGFNKNGKPMALGYYGATGELFANKNFLLNCIDYLTGYTANMETRSKVIKLRLLNISKVKEEKTKWQLINMFVPLILILLFAFIFTVVRQYFYARKNT